MDYDKLIEQAMAYAKADCPVVPKWAAVVGKKELKEYAAAISTLKAKNEKLWADWEKYQPREHWETLNEAIDNLRADLARMTAERDLAIEYVMGQCRYCKHNLVCTSRRGTHRNCWEWRGIKEN